MDVYRAFFFHLIFIFSFTRAFTNLDFPHLTLIDRFTMMDDGIITWKLSFVRNLVENGIESKLIKNIYNGIKNDQYKVNIFYIIIAVRIIKSILKLQSLFL